MPQAVIYARLAATLDELRRATAARHRLRIGSPEHGQALEYEIHLSTEIRRLAEFSRLDAMSGAEDEVAS